jgi:hypothetical protein
VRLLGAARAAAHCATDYHVCCWRQGTKNQRATTAGMAPAMFSFSYITLEAPPPQARCLPKRAVDEDGSAGPIAEFTDAPSGKALPGSSPSGNGFAIPSEAAVPSPDGRDATVNITPLRSSISFGPEVAQRAADDSPVGRLPKSYSMACAVGKCVPARSSDWS